MGFRLTKPDQLSFQDTVYLFCTRNHNVDVISHYCHYYSPRLFMKTALFIKTVALRFFIRMDMLHCAKHIVSNVF